MISARRKRHIALAALAFFGYVAGIPTTRLLDSYRGIVLDVAGDKVHVAYIDRMPRWRSLGPVQPGTIVEKARGAWSAKPVEPLGKDIALKALYERYYAAYEARIVRLDKPDFMGAGVHAVAEKADGSHVTLTLGAPHLAFVKIGTLLRKQAKSWDPVAAEDVAQPKPQS